MSHSIPFEIEDQDVDQFNCPPTDAIRQETAQLVEVWDSPDDLTKYIDYGVKCIRQAQALAQAAKTQADFANKTAKGYLANVEYRRGLIESALELSVAQGLVPQPKLKATDYSLGIQATAGRVEVDSDLDLWREGLNEALTEAANLLIGQIMEGSPIELDEHTTEKLARFSTEYLENAGSVAFKDMDIITVNTTLTWDKKYLAQALKNNWLTEKLAGLFKVIKGKSLVIRGL